jgi:hypothetical protein
MSETIIIRNDLHRSELGVANGVASLDGSGKIPGSQIDSSTIINDSGSTSADIWSASKTQTQINTAVVGLLDDRGNFTPAGSYPATDGSGTAGAILKGDIWQITGLGAGVSALVGTRSVSDGDWIRAVVDAPGQTDSNWSETSSSSSNLGNSNLPQTSNARTYTLPTGATANQYLEFDNFGGGNLLKLMGDNAIDLGSTTNFIRPTIYLDSALTDQFYIKRGSANFATFNPRDSVFSIQGGAGAEYATVDGKYGWFVCKGANAGLQVLNAAGNNIILADIQSGTQAYIRLRSGVDNKIVFYAGNYSYFIDPVTIGGTTAHASALLDIQSTSKGLGLPTMTTAQKNAIGSPRAGLCVYDTTLGAISCYNGAAWA